jgi:hypothetical protein
MSDPFEMQIGGKHYMDMPIQPIKFIHANGLGFIEGCVIKYVCRHKGKNGKQDLEKAIHLLQQLISLEYDHEKYDVPRNSVTNE